MPGREVVRFAEHPASLDQALESVFRYPRILDRVLYPAECRRGPRVGVPLPARILDRALYPAEWLGS